MRKLSKFDECVKMEKVVTEEDLTTLKGECWVNLEEISDIEHGVIYYILKDNELNTDQKIDLIDEILQQDEVIQKLELFLCYYCSWKFEKAYDKIAIDCDFETYENCTDLTQLGYRYLQEMYQDGYDSEIKYIFGRADTLEEFNDEIYGIGYNLDIEYNIVEIDGDTYLIWQ